MHEPQLSVATLPATPRLFRVRLRPYSLGHEIHLYRRSSPFLDKDWTEFCAIPRGEKLAFTMQAIEVCSRDYAGNLRPPKNWGLWRRYCEWCDLDATVKTLWNYLHQAHDGFQSDIPSREGYATRIIGAPHVLRLYQFVLEKVPRHELSFYSNPKHPTAWDFPYSLATMMLQTEAELKGDISIFNYKDKALADFAAKRDLEVEHEEADYEAYMASQNN